MPGKDTVYAPAMQLWGWEIWVAVALLLAGGELLHGAFVLFAFALACLPAALASALGAGLSAQLAVFAVSALIEVPLLARWAHARRSKRLATNGDAILGKRGKVLKVASPSEDGVLLLTGPHGTARSSAGARAPLTDAHGVQT